MPILIMVAGLGVYLNSFDDVFLFDDLVHIVQNERIRQLRPLRHVLSGTRPVVDLSLAVNYRARSAFGGDDVWGYHAVNVTVHVLAALTLYGIVRRTLLRAAPPKAGHSECSEESPLARRARCFASLSMTGPRASARGSVRRGPAPWLAFTIALVWVVHPLLSQSVTYLIQRAESMMGLFYLLTLYCLIRGAEPMWDRPATAGRSHRWGWYAAGVLSCALGMGSKAVMVTAPLVVLLYDRVFLSKSFADTVRRRWGLYLGLTATWSVLWMSGIAKGVLNPANKFATVGFGFKEITPAAYALTQPGVVLHYLALSVWPHPLCLDYNWPVAQSAEAIVPQALVIAPLLVATTWACLKQRWLGFLGAWFFIILAPTSSFIPIKDVLFEHRMYLSSAAVIVLLVIGGYLALLNLFDRLALRSGMRRWMVVGLVGVVVTSLAYDTVRRNEDYRTAVSMWRDVTAKRPGNARAYEQLGTALVVQGDKKAAVTQYRHAVRVDPDFTSAHANLANALFETGQVKEAVRHYHEVLRVQPYHAQARINLGHALGALGQTEDSIEAFRDATQIEPQRTTTQVLARAHYNLGSALGRRGELDEAIAEYREALRLWPLYEKAHFSLGWALALKGNLEEAIEHYRQTLQINPNHEAAQRALDQALAKQQRSVPE